MFESLLQFWGGSFYLLNKIFFSQAERNNDQEKIRFWRINSWIVYLIGLPAWVIIFLSERNWIAASVEGSGALAMIIGLIIAIRGKGKEPKWFDYIARLAIVVGITYSLYDFGGITTVTQLLEIGVTIGFLFGTYQLAKQNPTGYLWFLLMNSSNAILMLVQNYPWLFVQQLISLGFVLDAFRVQKVKSR